MLQARSTLVACIFAVSIPIVGQAHAQEAAPPLAAPPGSPPPPPAALPPPPPPSEAGAATQNTPPPSEAGAPVPIAPPACVPACRSGFTCLSGRCVSSCNPPCSSGDVCTGAGECVAASAEPERSDAAIEAPANGAHRHDGFFLRLTLGAGGGAVGLDAKNNASDTSIAGGGWASSLDIGASNGDNLAIFGRLREASLADPGVYVDGDKIGDADATVITQGMVGGGISYFIMPLNMYLGAAIGFAVISGRYERPGRATRKYNGDVGFGFDAEIGKEWWVADDWGIGIAARLSIAEVPGGDSAPPDANLGAAFVSVLLSVTYQ
jgi:hypothetical protein